MTSKIVVNNIEADSGINTVTFGGDISGNFVGNVTGNVNSVGVITATNLTVGTAGTAITTVSVGSSVGIGSTLPQTKLDVVGGIKGVITQMTSQVSTAGTSINFTGIPSWAKRVTVMFDGVSVSGTSAFLIQLGDAGGIETTGYSGGGGRFAASSFQAATFTAGFGFNNVTAACLYSGNTIINNLSGNTWIASGSLGGTATEFANITGGSKTLSDTLTQVRITTVNGTDTFDAGTINIMYEG